MWSCYRPLLAQTELQRASKQQEKLSYVTYLHLAAIIPQTKPDSALKATPSYFQLAQSQSHTQTRLAQLQFCKVPGKTRAALHDLLVCNGDGKISGIFSITVRLVVHSVRPFWQSGRSNRNSSSQSQAKTHRTVKNVTSQTQNSQD